MMVDATLIEFTSFPFISLINADADFPFVPELSKTNLSPTLYPDPLSIIEIFSTCPSEVDLMVAV